MSLNPFCAARGPLVARDGLISDSQILPADIRRFGIHFGNLAQKKSGSFCSKGLYSFRAHPSRSLNRLLLIGEEGLFGTVGFHDGILQSGHVCLSVLKRLRLLSLWSLCAPKPEP